MSQLTTILLLNLSCALVLMVAGWLVSLRYNNVTLVDSLWGLGFAMMAWITLLLSDGFAGRAWLIALLVTAWALRLSTYLTLRNWGKGEDPRYAAWRAEAGKDFRLQSLFKVFLLQALFMWVIALAMQIGLASPAPARWTLFDTAGLAIWLTGFIFESVGDAQLKRFKADPANRGKVMDRGLWRYTRHPNYFGELLVWWGIYTVTMAVPGGWWTVVSPLVITVVLLKMTGIPLTEQTILEKRPEYKTYIQQTSSLIPWFPRKEAV